MSEKYWRKEGSLEFSAFQFLLFVQKLIIFQLNAKIQFILFKVKNLHYAFYLVKSVIGRGRTWAKNSYVIITCFDAFTFFGLLTLTRRMKMSSSIWEAFSFTKARPWRKFFGLSTELA